MKYEFRLQKYSHSMSSKYDANNFFQMKINRFWASFCVYYSPYVGWFGIAHKCYVSHEILKMKFQFCFHFLQTPTFIRLNVGLYYFTFHCVIRYKFCRFFCCCRFHLFFWAQVVVKDMRYLNSMQMTRHIQRNCKLFCRSSSSFLCSLKYLIMV